MTRPCRISLLIAIALFLPPYAAAEESAIDSDFEPATDAVIVLLDKPEHRINLPQSEDSPRGPDRSFQLDPELSVEGIAISADGQDAFLFVFESDDKSASKPLDRTEASVRQVSLDSGEQVARYELPKLFASKRYPDAWGTGFAGLAVSPDSRSVVIAFLPYINLSIQDETDRKYLQAMTFFRWDAETQKLTDERLVQSGGCRWKMCIKSEQMIAWIRSKQTQKVECWDTRNLTAVPLVEFSNDPNGQPDKDGAIGLWRECFAYDSEHNMVDLMLHWRSRSSSGDSSIWLQQFDTTTSQPTGPGTKFKHKHEVMPISLRGEHLLLHEQDQTGLDHRQTVHIWNVRSREHVAAIDITPSSKSYFNDIDLVPDGSAVIYEKQLLDLNTFQWTEARLGVGRIVRTAITPDGSRLIEVFTPPRGKENTSASLEVYDLKQAPHQN